MSNNKQSMKLYTEEQVRDFIDRYGCIVQSDLDENQLNTIELPSIEEILVPFPTTDDYDFRDGKEVGCWMNGWEQGFKEVRQNILNKIQGGNK